MSLHQPNVDEVAMRDSHLFGLDGQRFHVAFCEGSAILVQRAEQTLWSSWCALQSSKVHNRLIVVCSSLGNDEFLGKGCKNLFACCAVDGSVDAKKSREHAINIAINNSRWEIVGKRTDSCCRVVAHSFQVFHLFIVCRKATLLHNLLSGGMKIARARIIA